MNTILSRLKYRPMNNPAKVIHDWLQVRVRLLFPWLSNESVDLIADRIRVESPSVPQADLLARLLSNKGFFCHREGTLIVVTGNWRYTIDNSVSHAAAINDLRRIVTEKGSTMYCKGDQ